MEALIFTVFAIILLQVVGPIVDRHRRREEIREFERWAEETMNRWDEELQKDFGLSGVDEQYYPATKEDAERAASAVIRNGRDGPHGNGLVSEIKLLRQLELDLQGLWGVNKHHQKGSNRISRAIERNMDQLGPKPKQALFGGGDE